MADPQQTFLSEPFDTWYGCPHHPQWAMAAIIQRTHQVPVTVTKSDGIFEIEMSPSSEFVHEMATEVTIAYCCTNPDCAFVIMPEDLHELVERHHERQLGR